MPGDDIPSRFPPTGRPASSACAPGTGRSTSTRARCDVAHAYTPGLRVTDNATLKRERRLPLRGNVLLGVGERVEPDTVVARTELPGNVQIVNVAAQLSLDPAVVPAALARP